MKICEHCGQTTDTKGKLCSECAEEEWNEDDWDKYDEEALQ